MVPGWQGIEIERGEYGELEVITTGGRDVEWGDAEPEHSYGCANCGEDWTGALEAGLRMPYSCATCGWSGGDLAEHKGCAYPMLGPPSVHPGQLDIGAAA